MQEYATASKNGNVWAMKGFDNKKAVAVLMGIAILAIALYVIARPRTPGKLDSFATCIKEKSAVFYGAFWCPHCANQKAMFGGSAGLLPYTECSTPDGRGQLRVCTDKDVKGYPTWIFGDGSREAGEVSLEKLAAKTGCELPKEK